MAGCCCVDVFQLWHNFLAKSINQWMFYCMYLHSKVILYKYYTKCLWRSVLENKEMFQCFISVLSSIYSVTPLIKRGTLFHWTYRCCEKRKSKTYVRNLDVVQPIHRGGGRTSDDSHYYKMAWLRDRVRYKHIWKLKKERKRKEKEAIY